MPLASRESWSLSLGLIHVHAYPQVVTLTRMMTWVMGGALYTLPPH
jgi:hypothetical protein